MLVVAAVGAMALAGGASRAEPNLDESIHLRVTHHDASRIFYWDIERARWVRSEVEPTGSTWLECVYERRRVKYRDSGGDGFAGGD